MQGQLLIAHPLLNDGFFNRSVVYLTNHNEEGSAGFNLNFKTQFYLRDVRPQIKNGNFPIFEGGPVAKNQLFFLHTLGHDIADSSKVSHNILISYFIKLNMEKLSPTRSVFLQAIVAGARINWMMKSKTNIG
jgi:putative AlgH/UPF0301 family transcriptional regulator